MFFVGYLAFTTLFWAISEKLPAQTTPTIGGFSIFGALLTPAMASARHGARPAVSALAFLLNSLAMAGVATAIYALIRKLRAA
jgi:hypothetical protein